MNTISGRSQRPVLRVPRAILAVATLLLPRGVSRDRYRREFAAELHGMSAAAQISYALHVALHAPALRAVLVKGPDAQHLPFLCRTQIHHHWQKQVTEEGANYEVCRRCGEERTQLDNRIGLTGMALGIGSTNH